MREMPGFVHLVFCGTCVCALFMEVVAVLEFLVQLLESKNEAQFKLQGAGGVYWTYTLKVTYLPLVHMRYEMNT